MKHATPNSSGRTNAVWLWLCFLLMTAGARQSFAPPPTPDDVDAEVQFRTTQVEPFIAYLAPQNDAEARAAGARIIADAEAWARARGYPLHLIQLKFLVRAEEVPEWVKRVRVDCERKGIKVGEQGEIIRWDKEYEKIWAPKRERIARAQAEGELLHEIQEGEAAAHLPKLADAELARGILDNIDKMVSDKVGIPSVVAIVEPYVNAHTGVNRPRWGRALGVIPVPMEQQAAAIRQAAFFMMLTGIAAGYQVFNRFGGDVHMLAWVGVAVAATWRFTFTYFKDAGNLRHQLSKFYNEYSGRVTSSFWWSLGSQIFDSLVSSFTFQFLVHRTPFLDADVLATTLLTSFAGSFAKVPIVQFTGGQAEKLKVDVGKVVGSVDNLSLRYQTSVRRGHLPESAAIVAELDRAQALAKEGAHQQSMEALMKVIAAVEKLESANETALANFKTELNEVRNILEGCISLSNRLYWTNAAIDFGFDVLKFGSLMGITSINVTYGALAFAGMGFLYGKHLLGRTTVKGLADLRDMMTYQARLSFSEETIIALIDELSKAPRAQVKVVGDLYSRTSVPRSPEVAVLLARIDRLLEARLAPEAVEKSLELVQLVEKWADGVAEVDAFKAEVVRLHLRVAHVVIGVATQADRLGRAIENRRAFNKALKWSFERITRFTGLRWLLGEKRVDAWTDWAFRFDKQKPLALVKTAIAFMERYGLPVQMRLKTLEEALDKQPVQQPTELEEEVTATSMEARRYILKRGLTQHGTVQVWISVKTTDVSCDDLLSVVSHSSGGQK